MKRNEWMNAQRNCIFFTHVKRSEFSFLFIIVVVFCQQFYFNFNRNGFPLNIIFDDVVSISSWQTDMKWNVIFNNELHEKLQLELSTNKNIKLKIQKMEWKIICHLICLWWCGLTFRAFLRVCNSIVHFLQSNLYVFWLCHYS